MVNSRVYTILTCSQNNFTWRLFNFVTVLSMFMMAGAADALAASRHINIDSTGYSISRYDPVAYFTEGRPRRGAPEFSTEYKGAKYAFVSESNKDRFLANPEKYVPQYGGYCAYGAAHGSKSDVDPEVWDIVDGKLYLMVSSGTKAVWKKRKVTYIEMANKAWLSITSE